MITEHAKEEIRRELREEGFGGKNLDYSLRSIERMIEVYRSDKEYLVTTGVTKRLIVKYSNDNYQVKEMAV